MIQVSVPLAIFAGSDEGFSGIEISTGNAAFQTKGDITAIVCGTCVLHDGTPIGSSDIIAWYRKAQVLPLERLFGHFAVVVLDRRHRRILFARDAFAIFPFFISHTRSHVRLSTHGPRPGSRTPADIDLLAIEHFLATGWTPSGRTLDRHVRPVPPGRLCWLDAAGYRLSAPTYDFAIPSVPVLQTPDWLLEQLMQSVARLIRPTFQRIGVMLSGGIDSALLARLVQIVRPKAQLRAFTVGNGEDDPELRGARETCAVLGIEHVALVLTPADLDTQLPYYIATAGTPDGHEEYPCLHALHRLAQVDVMVSGNLSDTLFAGMPSHREAWIEGNTLRTLGSILSASLSDRDERMSTQSSFAIAHGMLPAMPYADPNVARIALAVPDALKLNGQTNKILLRDAARAVLPAHICDRPKGLQQLRYDSQMQAWLVGRYRAILPSLISRGIVREQIVNHRLEALLDCCNEASVHAAWRVLAFELWCQHCLDLPRHEPARLRF